MSKDKITPIVDAETETTITATDQDLGFADGMENLIASMGTKGDKRSYSKFKNNKRLSLDTQGKELNAMYRTDWLSGKVVDIVPEDMTREWRTFAGDLTPEQIKTLTEEEDRLNLRFHLAQAHKWARLYGTGFILLVVDDNKSPDQELVLDQIKPGQLKHIKSLERQRLHPEIDNLITDPMNENFGMPQHYRFADVATPTRVHCSRLIRFEGVRLPYQEFRENNYFSDSILDRMYEAIINFNTVTDGTASMVYDTNVGVLGIKNLMSLMGTTEGEKLLRKRVILASLMKSFNNMLMVDADETYSKQTNTFSGLDSLLDKYSQVLSAASDIPATRLLGTSAPGLNGSGENELRNYYDMLRSKQKSDYKPMLDTFDMVMAASLGMNHEDLEYDFAPLYQMTEKEIAELEYTRAQRDQIYLNTYVVTELEVAKQLQSEGTYNAIDENYIKALEKDLEESDEPPVIPPPGTLPPTPTTGEHLPGAEAPEEAPAPPQETEEGA